MQDYVVFDIECTYGTWNGRVGSRWSSECAMCSVGFADHDSYDAVYLVKGGKGTRPEEGLPFPDLAGIDVLVGHNIKFDLLWYWDHPMLKAFLKSGGRVWDTMYAEYLLSAQYYNMNAPDGLGLSLKECAERRQLYHNKLDIVASLWADGIKTEDINKEVLMEYMKYDILSTKDLYLAQVAQGTTQNQMGMIKQRMEGLLATTEMEFNGIELDLAEAEVQMTALKEEIEGLRLQLNTHVPPLPEECPPFNWGSSKQVSALLFGGDIKYKAPRPSLDEKGNKQYYLKTIKVPVIDPETGLEVFYKSGKNKGQLKMVNTTMPDTERGCKTKLTDVTFTLPRQVEPKDKWKSATEGYWSTGADVLEELKSSDIVIIKDILRLKGAEKDLGTYYLNEVRGKQTGMLTNIQELDGRVHGHFNHTVTATTRLSSSKPK